MSESARRAFERLDGAVIPLVWDVLSASAAKAAGATVVKTSGAGVAARHGLPDLGLTTAPELIDAAREIVETVGVPVVVDGDTGFGQGPVLARFIEGLRDAGVAAVSLEDQDAVGDSIARTPTLCAPETMAARISVAKAAANDEMAIIARTDVLGSDWDFEDTLRRVQLYLDAGADTIFLVFPRSRDDLRAASELANGRLITIAVARPEGGFIAEVEDVQAVGARALIIPRQQRMVFASYLEAYRLSMEGRAREIQEREADYQSFSQALGFARHTKWWAR